MKLTREQENEYRQTLWISRDDHIVMALRALLSHELDKVKELAITPSGGDISSLQGQAQVLKLFLKYLTVSPASTKQV